MRTSQGGTKMYCRDCDKITVCKAINPIQISYASGQRWFEEGHEDIQWFRRGRECQSCGHEFLTAELDEIFLSELVELRDSLSEIKNNAESYIKESASAATSLSKLNNSLKILRALNVYKNN